MRVFTRGVEGSQSCSVLRSSAARETGRWARIALASSGKWVFATVSGGDAFGESLADVIAVLGEPVAFGVGFKEVEGVVEEVVGSGV
jgi:hypothetical protein